MKRLPLILSCLALLLSAFAVHVSLHTRDEVQLRFHSIPAGQDVR
jgi:hypothetical protein